MQSLQVRTGEIKLQILDDAGEPRGIFKFNPSDIESAKNVLAFQNDFNAKQLEFETRANQCETPEAKVELLDSVCTYFNTLIDECFGAGSSELLFGGAKTLSMYDDFIQGIVPYYQKASEERVAKYSPKKTSKQ
jgi:hypothetical protein